MKKLLAIFLILFSFSIESYAAAINGIQDADYSDVNYPIRENAIVMILQPVPDNSGDFTMTLCNKYSHCRQTSMQENEIRYIGLFIEDMKPILTFELNKKLTKEEWYQKQNLFRKMYTDYMNLYDRNFGSLEKVTPQGIKFEVKND